MRAKLLFNSALFFSAAIISIIRANFVEVIISITFSILFFTLNLWLNGKKEITIFE